MRRVLLIASAAGVGVAAACGACGDSPATPTDAGAGADVQADVRDAKDEPTPCTPKPRPSYVPNGWVPWDAFAGCSGMYVPTKESDLPAPFEWEACDSQVVPQLAGCRQVKARAGDVPGTRYDAALDSNAKVLIIQTAGAGTPVAAHTERIGEADGPMRSAVMSTFGSLGYITNDALLQSLFPPFWIATVTSFAISETVGYVGGRIDTVAPTVAGNYESTFSSHGFIVGPHGILHGPNGALFELLDFDTGARIEDITTGSQDEGLGQSFPWFFGDSLAWGASSGRVSVVRRWDFGTPGPKNFIDYRPDPDHAAGNLGSDGKDMVWLEGHGPQISNAFWTTGDVWTSPYAATKADLKPRRLRSEIPNTVGLTPARVGCGIAGLNNGLGARIIRLSDGYSTFLKVDVDWVWSEVLVITCNEIFLRGSYKGLGRLLRIPVASLPFADLPD